MIQQIYKPRLVSLFIVLIRFTMLLLTTCTLLSSPAKADAFDSLRQNWYYFLTGATSGGSDKDIRNSIQATNNGASLYWKELQKGDADRQNLWANLDYKYSKDITDSYRRLEVMSLAYCMVGGTLYHKEELKKDIISALDWLYVHHYNENIPPPIPAQGSDIHNWWDYIIGTPLQLNNITVLLYDQLSQNDIRRFMAAIYHFTPDFTDRYTTKPAVTQFTAANRVWVSTVLCVKAIVLKDSAGIAFARDGLSPVFQYTTTGDGFYRDGSFIQHRKHPYTGGYGVSLLSRLTEVLHLLSHSQWEVTDTAKQNVVRWIYDSFEPVIFRGNLMSMTEGREISRKDCQEHLKGEQVMQSLALLAQSTAPEYALHFKQLVKTWYQEGLNKAAFFNSLPPYYILIIKDILNDKNIPPVTEAAMYKQFPNMDRAVQKTPDYAFAISMHSSRIFNYETRTGYENIQGWHTSDGQTYLYNGDRKQFDDNFWATVNHYRLPGTTVEVNTENPGFKTSNKSWVGGAALEQYGVTGMDLAPAGQTLAAKKSWFMLNNQIVALGAGIVNSDGKQVHTYIEQRKLDSLNLYHFVVDGETQPFIFGSDETPREFKGTHWACLAGKMKQANIGYYFPEATDLFAVSKPQTGSWKQMNVNYNNQPITQYYLTFWEDQGNGSVDTNGDKNKYAYVLLPGKTVAEVAAYAKVPDITILENTTQVQAVKADQLNIVAANFWTDTINSVQDETGKDYLTCNTKASVILQKSAGKITIAVSDPTMLNEKGITITLHEKVTKIIRADPSVKVLSLKPFIRIVVNVKGLQGATSALIVETQ